MAQKLHIKSGDQPMVILLAVAIFIVLLLDILTLLLLF